LYAGAVKQRGRCGDLCDGVETMAENELKAEALLELNADDEALIMQLFYERMVPLLERADARIGTLNCRFAGDAYRHWNLHFCSAGSSFQITGLEYDETSDELSLDL